MPDLTIQDVHISAALANVAVAYSQDADAFVHNRIFPAVPVDKQSNQYHVWAKGDLLRTDAQQRAPGTPAALSAPGTTTASYFCDRYAIGAGIPDPFRANADAALNLEQSYTEFLTQDILIRKEVDFAATYFTTSVWTGAASTGDMTGQAAPSSTTSNFMQWNDPASTPIEDIQGESVAVMERTAKKPNRLLLGVEVFNRLRQHPDLLDRIKYTQRGVLTEDLLAALFDVEQVLVMRATRNTANEGATASYDYIGGKNALLVYAENALGINRVSGGAQFQWTDVGGAGGYRVKRYRDEKIESDMIEVESWWDFVVVAADLGAFFTSAVA